MRLTLILPLLLPACAGSDKATTPEPTPRELQAVSYVPGTAWDAAKPPEEQALGPHLDYVAAEVAAKRLVANGLYTTSPRGLYLVSGDAAAFVSGDPGLSSNVLAHNGTDSWLLAIDLLTELAPGETAFVLRYEPGADWQTGRPLADQAIADHMTYIEEQVGAGVVVGGGPINGGNDGGMYVVRLGSAAAAAAFTESDPGVQSNVFAPTVDGWQLMNAPTP